MYHSAFEAIARFPWSSLYARLGITALVCGVLAVLSTGCGGASAEQLTILRSEVFSLKQDQRQLQHQISALDSLLRLKVAGLDNFKADFSADIRALNERLAIVDQRLNDTDGRLVRLQSELNTRQSSSAAQTRQEKEGTAKVSPVEIYDLAYKDFTSSNFQMAIEGFGDYLQRYPDSQMAAEAYFYIGSSYQSLKKYEEAIKNYRLIAEKFPDSRLHPDALFRIGECLIRLGDKPRGETYYQTLIQRFPDSDAAAAARARLNP